MPHRLIINDELVLYGPVGFAFFDEGFTALEVRQALAEFGSDDVTVRLNSGGGLAEEGVAIYHALRQHPGEVIVTVDAIAASAASIIAMSADLLVVPEESLLMIHQGSGLTIGTADDHEKEAEVLRKIDRQMASIYGERTGIAKKKLLSMMADETWLDGKEAVDQGFADEVTEPSGSEATAYDYRVYANAPQHLVAMTRGWGAHSLQIAACAAQSKEVDMTKQGDTSQNEPQTANPNVDAAAAVAAATAAAVAAQATNAPAQTADGGSEPADPAKAATARIQAILDHDEAKGREDQARKLAFETDLDPGAAIAILATAPKAEPDKDPATSYADRKAEAAGLGHGGGDQEGGSVQVKITSSDYYAARRKAMAAA